MNVVIIYRQLDGCLGWTVCRNAVVPDVKRYLRLCGHPALAVIRRKRHLLAKWDFEDD